MNLKQNNRIAWLDGFRGMACVLIFVHHFLLMLFPAVHYGETAPSYADGLDTALAQSPLSFVVNGGFLVALFCMISGIVVSLQVLTMPNRSDLADVTFKRYFRLMLPLLPVAILVYALLRVDGFANLDVAAYTQSPWAALYYREPISLGQALKSALVDTWFYGDDTLSTAFWMLSKLFYGTFLSLLLSVIGWKYPRRTWILYAVTALLLFGAADLFCAFCLGTLLAWIYVNRPRCFHKIAGVLLLPIGLLLGAYPSGVEPTNFYRAFDGIFSVDWHILGAFLTLYGFFSLPSLQNLLSRKPLLALGRISYSVYLLHIPLLFCVSAHVFLWAAERVGYQAGAGASFTVSLAALLTLCWVYHRTAERACGVVQGKILAFFRERSSEHAEK